MGKRNLVNRSVQREFCIKLRKIIMNKCMSVDDAVQLFGVGEGTVRSWVSAGVSEAHNSFPAITIVYTLKPKTK